MSSLSFGVEPVTQSQVIISVKSAKFRFMRGDWPAEIKECSVQ